jgi:OmpA-OmpF porin, OOP family
MKKLFTILAVCVAMVSANAQSAVKGNKFGDNWTLGISGGVITPTVNHAFFGSMRPTVTLELSKWFTPVYALAVQGQTGFNYDKLGTMFPESNFGKSKTAFDATQVMLLNKFNLSNLFCGYNGEPRFFEVEAYFGAGYTHFYLNGADNNGLDGFSSKTGLNFNFNLGEAKAWQINIKPAITWVLDGDNTVHPLNYNVNHSAVELTAGVTYKFATSNGTHNFVNVKEYDQAEVDGLNSKINALRGQVDGLNGEINNLKAQNAKLQSELNDCKNRKPEVVNNNIVNRDLESYVTFAQGKSTIERSQMPNVERVATYLKNHPDANVVIKGYASPEGSAEINAKLSKNRAEAVKKVLVKNYGIKSSRIQAEGQGVGNMFKEPDWNRVSICTLDK